MFLRHIYNHARNNPCKLAMVNSGEEISYRRLAQLIDRCRNDLISAPLPPDGIVAVIVVDLLHSWVLLMALRSLGRTTVSGASWSTIEALKLADLSAVICLSGDQATKDVIARSSADCRLFEVDERGLSELPADHLVPDAPEGPFGDHILCTSGTTGTYKKVLMSGAILDHFVEKDVLGIGGRTLSEGTIHHNGNFGPWTIVGYRMTLMLWSVGATLIVEQRGDGVQHFFDYPIYCAVLLPPRIQQLCDYFPGRPPGLVPLTMITGGGFITADLALQFTRQLNCDLYVNYAGTEFMVALEAQVRTDEDVIWLEPVEGQLVEIVDEDDRPVPAGEEGIIRIRLLRSDPTEYLDDPEATEQHFRDGYFYPGDLAMRRADGRVRVLGRVADVINLNGQKVAIEPVEERARAFLQVDNLCLFATQADDGKLEVLVVIEGESLPDEIRRNNLAVAGGRYFSRTRYALLAEFPRSENGMMKIKRREVLKLVS